MLDMQLYYNNNNNNNNNVFVLLLCLLSAFQSFFRFSHIIVSRRASTGRPTRSALDLQRHPGVGYSLSADLNLSYLDDLTLGSPAEAIAQDVQRIIDVGDSMGDRKSVV